MPSDSISEPLPKNLAKFVTFWLNLLSSDMRRCILAFHVLFYCDQIL